MKGYDLIAEELDLEPRPVIHMLTPDYIDDLVYSPTNRQLMRETIKNVQ